MKLLARAHGASAARLVVLALWQVIGTERLPRPRRPDDRAGSFTRSEPAGVRVRAEAPVHRDHARRRFPRRRGHAAVLHRRGLGRRVRARPGHPARAGCRRRHGGGLRGGSNTPLALSIMAVELLGANVLPHVVIVCVLAYFLTGCDRSIYGAQRLYAPKLGGDGSLPPTPGRAALLQGRSPRDRAPPPSCPPLTRRPSASRAEGRKRPPPPRAVASWLSVSSSLRIGSARGLFHTCQVGEPASRGVCVLATGWTFGHAFMALGALSCCYSQTMAPRVYATIGRAGDNDVVLEDPTVSNHHARVFWSGKTLMIEDLSSANGTFVDGERVKLARARPGVDLRCGQVAVPWSHEGLRKLLKAGAGARTLVMPDATRPVRVRRVRSRRRAAARAQRPRRSRCEGCGATLRTGTKPQAAGARLSVAGAARVRRGGGPVSVPVRAAPQPGALAAAQRPRARSGMRSTTLQGDAHVGTATVQGITKALTPLDAVTRDAAIRSPRAPKARSTSSRSPRSGAPCASMALRQRSRRATNTSPPPRKRSRTATSAIVTTSRSRSRRW